MNPIHPFPARMAPDLSRAFLESLPAQSRVIDPMCGSGTVVRQAVEAGHICVGKDIDPLAVLMSRAWVTRVEPSRIVEDAERIVERALALPGAKLELPWQDEATDSFARFWFGPDQLVALNRIAAAIKMSRYRSRDLLKVAFSRLIVTKERGASLARDVSHSRPHRVTAENDFDVYREFLRAAKLVARRLEPESLHGEATVKSGDARCVSVVSDGQFDAAITSPPYLNAIDYLRGHRLTLIWFGYSIAELRGIRSSSTGTERSLRDSPIDVQSFIKSADGGALPEKYQGWIRRYAADVTATLAGLRAVIKPGGEILLVVGNSLIRGFAIDNSGINRKCALSVGLEVVAEKKRLIPARRRYLPPPRSGFPLGNRMRSESVLTFRVPGFS